MKKLFLLLLPLFLALDVLGQKTMSTYQNEYLNKEFNIQVSELKANGKFDVYVECASFDNDRNINFFIVPNDKMITFTSIMDGAKSKYIEWSRVAKENNVTELDKTFENDKLALKSAFPSGRSWEFTTGHYNFRFKIVDDKHYLIFQTKQKLYSLTNRYITSDGSYIAFSSVNEINEFLSNFEADKIKEFHNKKNVTENLFVD
jgi:hypothetical protein